MVAASLVTSVYSTLVICGAVVSSASVTNVKSPEDAELVEPSTEVTLK